MGWLVNNFLGADASSTPQADNAETGTWEQAAEKTINLPYSILITDVSLTKESTNTHQYQFFVNGKAQENFLYSDMLNPDSDGRFKIADQGLVIPAGSGFQVRAAQKSGTQEATSMVIKYQEV